MKNTEDQRIENQVQEAREKEDADFAARDARRRRQEDAIDRSRKLQLERRQQRRQEEEEENKRLMEQTKLQAALAVAEEAEEEAERRLAAQENADFLRKQKAEFDRHVQVETNTRLQKWFDEKDDDEVAKRIGEEALRDAEATGQNPIPIKRAINRKPVEVLPAGGFRV